MPTAPATLHHEAALVAQCLAALEDLGVGTAELVRAPRAKATDRALQPDARVRLRGEWGHTDYVCEARRTVTHATLGAIAAQLDQLGNPNTPALLLTAYVPHELGLAMREHLIEFVDTAGNANLLAPGLRVWALGHKPTARPMRRGTTLQPTGLRVLYQILRAPEATLALTHRGLAQAADVALGGIGPILAELETRGWIGVRGDKRVLIDPRRAMARFEEGYAERLRDRLGPLKCRRRPGTTLEELATRVRKTFPHGQVLIGGELGAAALTRALRPQTATLHVQDGNLLAVMQALELLPDPGGDVTLMPPIGQPGTEAGPRGIADPILLRAELLVNPDDRLIEIATVLQTEHIEPRWR